MYFHNGIAVLEHDTHLSKWVVEHNRLDFDQNVLPFVLPYIKEGDHVLDAGANLGCYAFAFLNKVGANGHLYAFEPAIETFECLEHNLNTFDNADIFNMALSYKKGYCKVLRPTNNVGMNFCEEVNNADSIKVTTIDSLGLNKLDFIKLDVEGDELNVLIGGYNTINKFKPTMFIEINEHTLKRKGLTSLDVFNWLDKQGYSYENVYPNQKMRGDQYDIIAKYHEKN